MKNTLKNTTCILGMTFALTLIVWVAPVKAEEGQDESVTCPCSYDEDELNRMIETATKNKTLKESCTSGAKEWGELTIYAVNNDYGLVAKWDKSKKRGQCSTDKGPKNPDAGLKNYSNHAEYTACAEAIKELAGEVACTH